VDEKQGKLQKQEEYRCSCWWLMVKRREI